MRSLSHEGVICRELTIVQLRLIARAPPVEQPPLPSVVCNDAQRLVAVMLPVRRVLACRRRRRAPEFYVDDLALDAVDVAVRGRIVLWVLPLGEQTSAVEEGWPLISR